MEASPYMPPDAPEWNAFVDQSTNGTFLHNRGYMDYHSDRFTDASLIVRDASHKVVALFPASRHGATAVSHGGLTYGGLIVGQRHHATALHLEAWDAILDNLRRSGISELIYKPVPSIYCRYPSDDDLYALFRSGAQLLWTQVASALPLSEPLLFNRSARTAASHARRHGVSVAESDNLDAFWQMLEQVLMQHHGATPAHSLDEMRLLRSRFPQEIRLFTAADADGALLGGILAYFTGCVAHCQYIAVNDAGRRAKVLALIAEHIIKNECGDKAWFDFGTSCEDSGRVLNASLNEQKYRMGGRPVAYTAWRLKL